MNNSGNALVGLIAGTAIGGSCCGICSNPHRVVIIAGGRVERALCQRAFQQFVTL